MLRRRSASARAREESSNPSSSVSPPSHGSSSKHCAVNAYWDGDRSIVVVSRDSTGRRRSRRVDAEFSCFIRASEMTAKVERDLRTSRAVVGMRQEGAHWRVRFRTRDALRKLTSPPKWPGPDGERISYFEKYKITPLEADVHPVRRWLTENEVALQRPRRCYLDLETDSRVSFRNKEETRVLTWAVVSHEDGQTWRGVLEAETDAAERSLLLGLWEVLQGFDQVCAWNGDRFDFPVLRARTREQRISVPWNAWLWLDQLELFKKLNVSSSESGEEKTSFKLGAVASALLGETKDDLDASKSWSYWEAGGESRELLARYNVRDTELLRLIELKTGYADLLQTLCEATTTLPDSRGMNGTNYVEGFLLRLARGRDIHFRTSWEFRTSEKFDGALVIDPKKLGILRDVHVADFASLYPSIIQTWNMSPETIADQKVRGTYSGPGYVGQQWSKPRPAGHCEHPTLGWCFSVERQGLLAEAVTELKRLRQEWTDRKASLPPGTPEWKDADRRASAYKIAANTFYGVIGSPFSRFFVRDVAESVAQGGVWLLRLISAEAERSGMVVVYGDTDSVFVAGCTEAEFAAFVRRCNEEVIPKALAEYGCIRNEIKLAYEKQFDVVVMISAKRYAGSFVHYKGARATAESKPEIKGLEYKRGDSTRLARQLQLEVVERLLGRDFEPDWYLEEIARWKDRVVSGEIELRDLVLTKRLSQEIKDYKQKKKLDGNDAAQPPHVQVARVLAERGEDVGEGTRIDYVIADASSSPIKAIPASDATNPEAVDRYYAWEVLVYPPTQRVLEVCFPAYASELKTLGKARPPKVRARRNVVAVAGADGIMRRRGRGAPTVPSGQGTLW